MPCVAKAKPLSFGNQEPVVGDQGKSNKVKGYAGFNRGELFCLLKDTLGNMTILQKYFIDMKGKAESFIQLNEEESMFQDPQICCFASVRCRRAL